MVMATETKKTKPSQAMSTLMFWNKQNGKMENGNAAENGTTNGKSNKKSWLHSPESLVNGHVAYLVKVSFNLILFFPSSSSFLYRNNVVSITKKIYDEHEINPAKKNKNENIVSGRRKFPRLYLGFNCVLLFYFTLFIYNFDN